MRDKSGLSIEERQARIELLRTRAAIERETLGRQLAEAGRALEPAQLLRATLSGLMGGKDKGSMLLQWLGAARRHPILSSALPSLLLGNTRSRRVLRVAAIGLAGWQLYKAWQDRREL